RCVSLAIPSFPTRRSSDLVEHARQAVADLTRLAHEPVLFARVKLTAPPSPDPKRPCIAQANLDVNGRLIRAQAAEPSMYQALDRSEEHTSELQSRENLVCR